MDWMKEAKRIRKKKFAIAAFVIIVILALGLGLGLELQRCKDRVLPLSSCRSRCFQPFDDELLGCRCDSNCNVTNSCCYDYNDLCTQPSQQWECSRLRCGETRLTHSRCHCSDDCLSTGDCCTNYRHVCHGEKQWVEDGCDDLSTAMCPPSFTQQPLLLVSLDGLRADYMQTWSELIPVLHKLQTCGTSASFMQAAFPSKTFPNHYTIVTGLYPESNGLIDNIMYDPEFDAIFSLSSPEKDNPAWYLGQPIWHTARDQGLKSGTFFWPGSDVRINGSFPHIYRPYDGKIPFEERVFSVLQWLQLPEDQRPHFYTLYLEEPDKSGHSFGPVSGGLASSIQGVDRIMGQLMNGLKQIGLHRCVNVVVLADHGMEEISCNRKQSLQDLIGDTSSYFVIEGPMGRIRTRDKDAIVDSAGLVANMTCKNVDQKIKAYLKADLPKRLHFANSRRIEDVNVLVQPQWLFERFPDSLKFCSGGNHGYDNDAESMHAMFLSYGPKFKTSTQIEPFANIELYNLMCDVLQIVPSENNGTRGSLNHALRKPPFLPLFPLEQSILGACPLLSVEPTDSLGCSCSALSDNSINQRLNLTSEEESAAENQHLPFGRPRVLQSNLTHCLLHHHSFISSFSHSSNMPLWSSFTISRPMIMEPLPPVLNDCVRADVRVPASHSQRCDDYEASADIVPAFIYPPNLNSTVEEQFDALLMSNVAPMFNEFKKIWDYFHNTLLMKYASVYNGVNVLVGPVFDYDSDGKFDSVEQIQQFVRGTNVSVPTHYFVVMTSCGDVGQPLDVCVGELQSVCFLLPHRKDNAESCKSSEPESLWVEDLLWFHQARVRDVEWITGLDLYQESNRPIQELLRLKTRPTAAIHRKQ
uniref:Venom phosphodiesterase 1-like n=1 Tax=Gouania willdenowi TaxID=441366 RepID=A0A8C5GZ12_GOUWI